MLSINAIVNSAVQSEFLPGVYITGIFLSFAQSISIFTGLARVQAISFKFGHASITFLVIGS
ncbi:hypothetical protein SDC9_189549 [bioreactor metagenome]|uniref:Uncharacterized protein n=1 Tax=bioreactor metagenome TaxID=1076179 RepID=A0A645I3D4_9ZZZZ